MSNNWEWIVWVVIGVIVYLTVYSSFARADERTCVTMKDEIRAQVILDQEQHQPVITVCQNYDRWAEICKEEVCSTDLYGRPWCWKDRDKELFAICMGELKK